VERRKPRTSRIVLLVLVAVVALNLLGAAIDAATGGTPGGPRSSTYATGGDGLAAYYDLLGGFGHPVARLRQRPAAGVLDPSTTVVVLDPQDIQGREARALADFVRRGGRLVAGGEDPARWLAAIVPAVPRWQPGGATMVRPLARVPEVAGVAAVRTAAGGSWSGVGRGAGGGAGSGGHGAGGASTPALGSPGGTGSVLNVARVGHGRVALLADASPLQNRLLATAGNAALGIALAGPRGRRVVFVETVHGYGQGRGLAALPERWKWTLTGLLLAAAAWVASRVRRLGPPEEESRPLPPPRRAYVDALAGALARTHRPGASAERVRTAAREHVARRAGLGLDPADESLVPAATALGLSDEEAAALTRPARNDDEDLLLAGRALARTRGRNG
jgi:hypothetical protein